jgi:hypothetical protein
MLRLATDGSQPAKRPGPLRTNLERIDSKTEQQAKDLGLTF